MVVGVEGNVHVGKTTYIMNNFSDFNIIKEIEFKEELNDYDRQLYYINQEILKKDKLTLNSVLDRTIISTAIYTINTNTLNRVEKAKLKKLIKDKIKSNEIIIPNYIYNIIYPYKLISFNHVKLSKEKGTQNTLVDYDYYLKYSLFFSNRFNKVEKIIATDNYRQIISYKNSIFNSLTNNISINSKVLLDGCPAIGKSTIGIKQNKYRYIEEFKYKKYTIHDYSNQIDSIVKRINILNDKNILLDTSFLMGITHLFYNVKIPQKLKLKIIDEIMSKVELNKYITRIVYLTLDKEKIIKRKENDKNKLRNHFYDNFKYLDDELNFYITLDNRLGELSNISIVDASPSIDEIIEKIEMFDDKPLLLIDLFYEIRECVERGEL